MKTPLDNILFIDVETAPLTKSLYDLSSEMQSLWLSKMDAIKNYAKVSTDDTDDEAYFKNAGIYSEFAKIICISAGVFYNDNNDCFFKIKSFVGTEVDILNDFSILLNKFFNNDNKKICGHNIKEFDIPFICRRMLINRIPIPRAIDVSGKKPWEVNFLDTLEMWRFGDRKNYTSLKLLSAVLDIPTPKDDIDGSQVATVYYNDNDIDRISIYCQKDVLATARLYQRINSLPVIADSNTIFV